MSPWLPPLVYAIWTVLVLGVAVGSARRGRRPTRRARLDDLGPADYAFLAGGPARAADLAILTALRDDTVHLNREGRVVATGTAETGDVVRRVLREEHGGMPLRALRARVTAAPEIQSVGTRLFENGLIARPEAGPRRIPRAALFLTIVLGVVLVVLAFVVADDGPSGLWLSLSLFLAVVGIQAGVVGLLLVGVFGERVVPTGTTTRHLMRVRRDDAAVAAMAPGGLGAVALSGLNAFPDPLVKEIFRRNAPERGAPAPDATWCGGASCAAPQRARAGSCGGAAEGCGN